jgi:hypothetical protein
MGATYRIVVRGEIDDRFAFLFNGMRMERLAELGLDLLGIEQLGEPVGLAAWAPTQGKGKE